MLWHHAACLDGSCGFAASLIIKQANLVSRLHDLTRQALRRIEISVPQCNTQSLPCHLGCHIKPRLSPFEVVSSIMYWFMTYCRPFVRSCLFQPVERGRLSKVVQQAATQASVTSLLENHAVVEIAAQAAISCQWDRWCWQYDICALLLAAKRVSSCVLCCQCHHQHRPQPSPTKPSEGSL